MSTIENIDAYVEDEAHGDAWSLMLGDSCERLRELPDESVDLSICSPPFDSLYTYSPSVRDLGNSASRIEFLDHYRFIVAEQLRVTKPGRNACIHVQQVATKKAVDGYVGLTDFRGDVIRLFQQQGWIYFGETTVWKDPQAQSIRTKSQQLAFASKNRDSARIRPALADYLLIFKKPGDNETRIPHDVTEGELTNDDWIDWASPIWTDTDAGGYLTEDGHISPVWFGIRESDTLNARAGREAADERHICPLQLGFIDRCIRLYSNPGEIVLTPFAGIGSELYQSIKRGRHAVGVELKPSYWQAAVNNLRALEAELTAPTLFDDGAA
ncbi:DNA-methyltransferase [Gordonia sp. (in: high G+C Gram-positive bacteria)]|uniref:DNA-methyltransferase n=1 Tax=Gordonia sp. (in: high G+C Gram-positive bacteria) TaxID=84139 RepID=UPI003F9A7243